MIYKVLNKKINKKIIQKCCKIGDNYLIDRNKIDQLKENEKKSLNLHKVSDRYVDYATLKKPSKVVIKGIEISNFSKPIIIAGPCSIESQQQFEKTYRYMKNIGCIDIVRGGLFKPRTSNYDFQGLGKKGLEIMKNIIKDENIPIVSEVMSIEELMDMKDSLDIIQIGARNMQNYPLLKACGRVSNPIILKRGLSEMASYF
jgi:3-deoxy-7-phosphoheptulonate synthase